MPEIYNPFDDAGFSVAYMTEAMNIIPNTYGRIGQLGLFVNRPVTTTTVVVERRSGTLNLLPSVPRGGPATKANRSTRDMRAFLIPHIPHDDEVLPEDLQNIRQFAEADRLETLERIMADKMEALRRKHGQTLEYMRLSALKGVLKDGAGATLFNWHDEFGYTKKTVDFDLGTAGTDVDAKCMEVLRHMEDNLTGESMSGVRALVSPTFFDKLTAHAKVREAFLHFTARPGSEPLREDVRRFFPFKGIVFEEYNATFTLSTGQTEKAFDTGYGVAVPLGTSETFRTFFAPANFLDRVNTPGDAEVYVRQVARADGRAIDILSESNPLPMVRRPNIVVEVRTST